MLDRLETTLRVRGGVRLEGSVATHGAKNAALPIMAAAILCKGKVTLHRVPRITDVSVMWSLLEALGARIRYEGDNTVTVDASNVASYRAPYTLVRKLAASFDIVGPLLGRFGKAEVPLPGGCVLGTRATDMHEQAFLALGCEVRSAHGYLIAESKRKRLQGATIEFRMPSVGATKNAMLAAVLAEGTTVIKNAAMEPEVVDVGYFLNAMGAKISGLAGDTLTIEGVKELSGGEYEIIPDRIVTGTLLLGGAVTRGDVTVTGCRPEHLEAFMLKLQECGVDLTYGEDWIRVDGSGITGGTDILTAPYPGFPTDSAAADGLVSHHRSGNERCRRVDLQRALLVRKRACAHGRRRARIDGKQHRRCQRRSAAFRRAGRSPRHSRRRGARDRGSCRRGRNRDHRSGIYRPRLRTIGRIALRARRPGATQQRHHAARRTGRDFRNARISAREFRGRMIIVTLSHHSTLEF